MGTRMWILRQHTWRRNAGSVTPIAVSDDPSLLEERAQGMLPVDSDAMLVWQEQDMSSLSSIRFSTPWHYANAEHYFSITTIPNLTR